MSSVSPLATPAGSAAGAASGTSATPVVLPVSKAVLWLAATAFLALAAYYFIGVDQGAVSVFGKDMHVHEFVHDARHFLGFPCH